MKVDVGQSSSPKPLLPTLTNPHELKICVTHTGPVTFPQESPMGGEGCYRLENAKRELNSEEEGQLFD
jgi:hypothetical protein